MDDLGEALNNNPEILFLGGGNPARIPEFESLVAEHLQRLASDKQGLHKLLGVYQSPQGNEEFIALLTDFFREHCKWPVSEKNIAVSNGSQSAFFLLFNMLAGRHGSKGEKQKILLPLMPEYLGYKEQLIAAEGFCGHAGQIELVGENQFKYAIDFDSLALTEDVGAMAVSRPTNPSGNVITDGELEKLNTLCAKHNIPLLVDCAYGQPFPGVIYTQSNLVWQENNIFVLSLSKLGLPGVRTGIVVANEEIIQQFSRANTVMSLACGNLGPQLLTALMKSHRLDSICSDIVLPYYQQKRALILSLIEQYFSGLAYKVHVSEGAFFVWLWFPELKSTSQQLYQQLKSRNVLIMAGEHFFYGLEQKVKHSEQCIRLNFCQSEATLDRALGIVADEVKKAC